MLLFASYILQLEQKDWGEALTSSVPVKNLAKQLCRSSNSTREVE